VRSPRGKHADLRAARDDTIDFNGRTYRPRWYVYAEQGGRYRFDCGGAGRVLLLPSKGEMTEVAERASYILKYGTGGTALLGLLMIVFRYRKPESG